MRLKFNINFDLNFFRNYAFRFKSEIFGQGCDHFEEEISLTNLIDFGSFVRFDEVKVSYIWGFMKIAEKCQLLISQLKTIKYVLSNANNLIFRAGIDQNDQTDFNCHSQLLEHICNEIIPICDSSHLSGYKFVINFNSDLDSASNIIASILQMEEIKRCFNIAFDFHADNPTNLPIESILNWLIIQKSDRTNKQKEKEKILRIDAHKIQNAQEICSAIIKVRYFTLDRNRCFAMFIM